MPFAMPFTQPFMQPFTPRSLRRCAVAAAITGAAVLLGAGPAGAHVTVSADDATKAADDAILTFRVPNEEDGAVTMKIDIKFPAKNPIASVRPAPKPGWTITTKSVKFDPPIKTDDGTITQGIGEVIYTATSAANGIPVGDFEAFQILVGPLPDAASVAFPTVQTYSNGKTVSWVEPILDPSSPPDNPTPVLSLTAAAEASPAASPAASSAAPSAAATSANGSVDLSGYATTSAATTARNLGTAGIVVGALGLLAGALGLARARRAARP